jgi:hypothetical protein
MCTTEACTTSDRLRPHPLRQLCATESARCCPTAVYYPACVGGGHGAVGDLSCGPAALICAAACHVCGETARNIPSRCGGLIKGWAAGGGRIIGSHFDAPPAPTDERSQPQGGRGAAMGSGPFIRTGSPGAQGKGGCLTRCSPTFLARRSSVALKFGAAPVPFSSDLLVSRYKFGLSAGRVNGFQQSPRALPDHRGHLC